MDQEPTSNDHPLALVVDDEPGLRRLMELELKAEGYRVCGASNGAEALEQVRRHDPAIVVMDWMMPVMDGIETLRRLRRSSPVPVIIVSARDRDADRVLATRAGADAYIVKPFAAGELGDRVRKLLNRSSADEGTILAGDLRIQFHPRLVQRTDGSLVPLSRTEWRLLDRLAADVGRPVARGVLLTDVWGPEYADDTGFLETWIVRMQRKLAGPPGVSPLAAAGDGYQLG